MPSSYSFNVEGSQPEPTSTSYRPNKTGETASSAPSSSEPKTATGMSNGVSNNNDLNVDKEGVPDKENYDKAINKIANDAKDKNDADLDAKWRANYVATPYDGPSKKRSEGTETNGRPKASNGKTESLKEDDDLDARWKMNYVPTPYDINKVEVQEATEDAPPVRRIPARPKWTNKTEFLFSCFSLTVGMGNVVRFPYMAYNHGGGAFLLLYVIFLTLVGVPLFFLELGLGQYAQLGPLNVFKCVSAMQGIGVAMSVLSLLTAVYANQMVAYCLYYLFASLAYIGSPLPWTSCGHAWNTHHCYEMGAPRSLILLGNTTIIAASPHSKFKQTAAQQFFSNQVLHKPVFRVPSDDIGTIRWDLTLCLVLAWTLVFLVVLRGVKSTGKAAYALAIIPVVVLFILMINGLLMQGADIGLLYLFAPRWSDLTNLTVWAKALEQVLVSLSLAHGGVIMYGSYNSFRNKVHLDAVVMCVGDLVVSIIASVAVFAVLGAMAHELGLRDVANLPDMGESLALVVYPSAIGSALPVPHLWAVLFYVALITLGLGSLAGHVHVVVGGILDTVPRLRASAMTVAGGLCCCGALLALPLCAEERGYFLLNMLSQYGVGVSVMVVAACELLTLSWLYGVRRLSEDFAFMLGYNPSIFWKLCWTFLSPVTVIVMLIFSVLTWTDPAAALDSDPTWATPLRWTLTAVSIGWIPVVFILMVCKRLVT
ncbi:sodium-dependent proline transporter, partial [Hyalella azteca]|uniref:Sodium-dependent proline transporter n=1 Tax=Hyalella azteca TaxID=294128 RepID=A0A8B7P828_HYAAZ